MAESNKILTVSYGTFSCTLEGFDDAFTTMKAIAEYFRDLAADDRYFGAEPATPDPEMLAKLASRAAARRVEARHGSEGYILRPEPGTALTANPQAEAAAPAPAAVPTAAPEDAPKAVEAQTDVSKTAEVAEVAEPVAAVAPDTATPEPTIEPAATPVAETPDAADSPVAEQAPAPQQPASPVRPAIRPSRPVVRVTPNSRPVQVSGGRVVTVSHPDSNSVAAKLQRIRDVVAKERAAAPVDYIEDEHAEDGTGAAARAFFETPEDTPAPAALILPATAGVTRPAPAPVEAFDDEDDFELDMGLVDAARDFEDEDEEVAADPSPAVDDEQAEDTSEAEAEAEIAAAEEAAEDTEDDEDDAYAGMNLDFGDDEDDTEAEAEAEEAPMTAEEEAEQHKLEATIAALGAEYDAPADTRPVAVAEPAADEDDMSGIDLSAALAIANAPDEEEPAAAAEEALEVEAEAEVEAEDYDDEAYEDEAYEDEAYDEDEIGDEEEFDEDELTVAPAAEDEAYDETYDEDEDDGLDDTLVTDTIRAYEAETLAQPAPAAPARPVARVVKVKRSDFEAAVRDGLIEEDAEDEDDMSAPAAVQPRPLPLAEESSLSPEDEADLQQELMALEAEIARGEDSDEAEYEDEAEAWDQAEATPAAAEAEAWDDEDEDQGEDEAAYEVEEDLDEDEALAEDDLDEDEDEHAADSAEAATVTPRRRLLSAGDDDMDRILAETNNQLGDTDGTRRRSAIAHLRAAVAATKAEKQAGSALTPDEEEDTDAYREDLAQVVRPRRPVSSRGTEAPARRIEDRPAPLKLVAEQRVDIESGLPSGPVRPRRIRVADIAKQEEEAERAVTRRAEPDMDHDEQAHARAAAANAASFAEFASRVGASDLPDLLEAAASYLAFVEERDQFSRPQLMTKVRQVEQDNYSREDSLRHFGQLLREGKLRKVPGGRFTVSDRINFRPEERAAG